MNISKTLQACAFAASICTPQLLFAAPCDDATEAWTIVSDAIDALESGRFPVAERTIAPLIASTCNPSGTQADLVTRARAEALLIQLQLHARPVRERLQNSPQPPPAARRNTQAFNQWMRRTFTPFVQDVFQSINGPLTAEVVSLANMTADLPSIHVEAVALLADLFAQFGSLYRRAPIPPDIQRNPDLLAAYAQLRDEFIERFFATAGEGYVRVRRLSQEHHLEPRLARRASAWLAIHNVQIPETSGSDSSESGTTPTTIRRPNR
jgi:hypothetical protein